MPHTDPNNTPTTPQPHHNEQIQSLNHCLIKLTDDRAVKRNRESTERDGHTWQICTWKKKKKKQKMKTKNENTKTEKKEITPSGRGSFVTNPISEPIQEVKSQSRGAAPHFQRQFVPAHSPFRCQA